MIGIIIYIFVITGVKNAIALIRIIFVSVHLNAHQHDDKNTKKEKQNEIILAIIKFKSFY